MEFDEDNSGDIGKLSAWLHEIVAQILILTNEK